MLKIKSKTETYKTNDIFVALSMIIFFILFIDTFINVFALSIIYDILQISCVGLFYLGVILSERNLKIEVLNMTIAVLYFNLLYYIAFYSGMSFLQKYGLLFMTWFPLLLAAYCIQMSACIRKRLWVIANILICITCVTTLLALSQRPYISKMLANPSFHRIEYDWLNVGGYQFIYMIMTLLPTLIFNIDTNKRDFVSWISLALSAITIIVSQYTIALIIGSLAVASYFVLKKISNQDGKRLFVFLIILFVCFLLVRGEISIMIKSLIGKMPSSLNVLGERLISVAKIIGGEEDIGLASVRFSLYKDSLRAFYQSYLLGNFFIDSGITIGGHSGLLDILGMIGLPGVVVLSVIIYFYRISVYDLVKGRALRRNFRLTMYMFIIFSVVNPVFGFPAIMMGGFLFPVLSYYSEKED